MQLRCVKTSIDEVDLGKSLMDYLKKNASRPDRVCDGLENNLLFNVYAISYGHNISWVHICNFSDYYSLAYPLPFFEINDSRISKYWICGYDHCERNNLFLTFKEWVEDETFYEKLLNDDPQSRETFLKYKQLMDMEFPNPLIECIATVVQGNWVMCKYCDEVWETNGDFGVIRCPKCLRLLNNPVWGK